MSFDLQAHLHRQWEFSQETFGPGPRAAGVIDHIRKELIELEENPGDLSEWIDILILAFDGALRQGFLPSQIVCALEAKQEVNENRQWPDWRSIPEDQAIEHVRD